MFTVEEQDLNQKSKNPGALFGPLRGKRAGHVMPANIADNHIGSPCSPRTIKP